MTDVTQEVEPEETQDALPVDLDIPEALPVLITTPVVKKEPANTTIISHFTSGSDWDFCPPNSNVQLQIQQLLKEAGLYQGALNGKWGNLTVFSIQAAVGRASVRPDLELCFLVRDYAEELGGFSQPELDEAYLTQEVWEAFVRGLQASNTSKKS